MKPVIIIVMAVGCLVVATVGIMFAEEGRQERSIVEMEAAKKIADLGYDLTIQACRDTYFDQMEKLQKCLESAEETRQYYP